MEVRQPQTGTRGMVLGICRRMREGVKRGGGARLRAGRWREARRMPGDTSTSGRCRLGPGGLAAGCRLRAVDPGEEVCARLYRTASVQYAAVVRRGDERGIGGYV